MTVRAQELSEERSIAMHAAIAARIGETPEILARARARVEEWLRSESSRHAYAREWRQILARPAAEIAEIVVSRSERSSTLRSCSPFAGALDSRERWRIHREVRRALEAKR